MNLLNKLIELVFGKPERVRHPFFGEMTDAGDYYECKKPFKSAAKIVEIGLEKAHPDFDQNQIDFFNWLDENYDTLIERISPSLEDEINKMIPRYFIDDFKQNFRLDYLWIPKCDARPYQWEIGFSEVRALQHHCQLKMDGLKVVNIHIDG